METCENNTNINVFKITSATSKEGFKYSTSCYRYRQFFQQIAKKDIIPIDLNNNPVKHYSWLFFNVTVLDRPLGEGNNIRKEAQNDAPALKISFQKFFTM